MKVRYALGALFGAVALMAGLVVSAGTANADTTTTDPVTTTATPTTTPVPPPWHHGGGDIICTTATSCTQNGQPYTGSVSACTSFPCRLDSNGTLDHDPAHNGGPFGGHFRPGFPGYPGTIGGGVLNLLNGNVLVLDNGQQVNVCTVPSWQPFYSRYGAAHNGWLTAHQLNELRYRQLIAQANCQSSNVGGLTLVNGNLINLGSYGVVGGDTVNVCSYSNWNDFNGFGVRQFGGHWTPFGSRYGGFLANNWNQLRTRARCSQVVVVNSGGNVTNNTTTVEQAPAPAAAPESAPAPAPLQQSGNYHYPSSAPDTGN